MPANSVPTDRVFRMRIFLVQNFHNNVRKPRPNGAAPHSPEQSRHEVAASPWVPRAGQVAPCKVGCSKSCLLLQDIVRKPRPVRPALDSSGQSGGAKRRHVTLGLPVGGRYRPVGAAALIPGNARVRERLGGKSAMRLCGALPLYKGAAPSGRKRMCPGEYPG